MKNDHLQVECNKYETFDQTREIWPKYVKTIETIKKSAS